MSRKQTVSIESIIIIVKRIGFLMLELAQQTTTVVNLIILFK